MTSVVDVVSADLFCSVAVVERRVGAVSGFRLNPGQYYYFTPIVDYLHSTTGLNLLHGSRGAWREDYHIIRYSID